MDDVSASPSVNHISRGRKSKASPITTGKTCKNGISSDRRTLAMTKDKANKLTASKIAKLSKAKRSRRSTVKSKLPILPVEIVDHIAKFLLDDGLYGACANLNLCNHDIHRGTLPTLYKTVQVESYGSPCWMLEEDEWVRSLLNCSGTRYIRYLVLTCDRGNPNFPPFEADIVTSISERLGLSDIRAIVIRHFDGSMRQPQYTRNYCYVYLQPSYDTFNGTHHAELLFALDFGVPVSEFEICPSPSVRHRSGQTKTHTILPYQPERRSNVIQSCVIKYGRSSAPVEEDPVAIAEAFVTSLALVSYTRDLWEDDEDDDGNDWHRPCDLVWDKLIDEYWEYPCDRVRVEAEKDESMTHCMQVYAELLDMNSRFAAIPVDLYFPRGKVVKLDKSTVQPIFRPLRPVYKKACEAIGEDHVELVRMYGNATRSLVQLSPVFEDGKVSHVDVAAGPHLRATPDGGFNAYHLEDEDE